MKPLAICAIFRNEAPYILEWVAYHSMIGFDHFVLYDNSSNDGGALKLRVTPFGRSVTIVDWPAESGQLAAYRHFIDQFRDKFEWTAFIDTCEFIHILDGRSARDILGSFHGFSGILINWLSFGPPKQDEHSAELVLESQTLRLPTQVPVNRLVRSLVRNVALVGPDVFPHTFETTGVVCNPRGQECPNQPMQMAACDEVLVVNRYHASHSRRLSSLPGSSAGEAGQTVTFRDRISTAATFPDSGIAGSVPALRVLLAPYCNVGIPLAAARAVDTYMQLPAPPAAEPAAPTGIASDPSADDEKLSADLPNPDLLTRIPPTIGTVLDVGCGVGALGAAYRRANPRACVLGIERDGVAAAVARTRLNDVAIVDVEKESLPFDLADGLDCIIYGDVLQHLRDPWAVVRRHVGALCAGGAVLVCAPNVEHWVVADRLFRGNWAYEPSGILDIGHLRWFTLKSLLRELLAAGLEVREVYPRLFDPIRSARFADLLQVPLRTLGIEPGEYRQRAAPLQYVISAIKPV